MSLSIIGKIDIFAAEAQALIFKFFSISIRDLISSCPENFRDTYCQWFKLLTIPFNELQQAELREKRNRYLFLLCASLMTKNVEFLLNLSKKKHLSKDSSKKSVKVKGSKEIGREAPKKCSDANGTNFFGFN